MSTTRWERVMNQEHLPEYVIYKELKLLRSKVKYLEIIRETQQFTEEAENLLQSAIAESKENFKASL